MALILPKGIVVNSPDIEGQIESINTEPLDLADIAKFWKVYTTTKRRLLDPTAERLENYWWRIWGSRRRELNGATVARLFAFISDGESFVPLRGPPNRDEGAAPRPNRPVAVPRGALSATTLHRPSQARPSNTSSNLSKTPAPLPPILKKSKGSSLAKLTRTARFISPHESDADTNANSSTRSISPNSHVVVQPPSPESRNSRGEKKASSASTSKKKGFVASTAAKKKRPVIPRRQSSQSSTDAHNPTEPTDDKNASASEEPRNKGKLASKFQENFSPDTLDVMSTNKRASTKKSGKGKEVASQSDTLNDPFKSEDGGPGPSNLRSIENQQFIPAETLTEEELNELELQRTLLAEANARVGQQKGSHEENPSNRMLPHNAKGTAKVAVANAEAIGQLEVNDIVAPLPQVSDSKSKIKGKGRIPEEVQRGELFAKRPVPPIEAAAAAPTPASDNLARSKSQLTLLLEKDRAKSKDNKKR